MFQQVDMQYRSAHGGPSDVEENSTPSVDWLEQEFVDIDFKSISDDKSGLSNQVFEFFHEHISWPVKMVQTSDRMTNQWPNHRPRFIPTVLRSSSVDQIRLERLVFKCVDCLVCPNWLDRSRESVGRECWVSPIDEFQSILDQLFSLTQIGHKRCNSPFSDHVLARRTDSTIN